MSVNHSLRKDYHYNFKNVLSVTILRCFFHFLQLYTSTVWNQNSDSEFWHQNSNLSPQTPRLHTKRVTES